MIRPTRPKPCCSYREHLRTFDCRARSRRSPRNGARICAGDRRRCGSCNRNTSVHASSSSARPCPFGGSWPASIEPVKQIEQLFHRTRLRQRLAIEPQGLGVGNRILESQAEKPHEREAVAKLVFRLIVRKIVERLQHQRLEDHHFIPWLAPCRTLARHVARPKPACDQRCLQLRPQRFPRNHRRDRHQRIVLDVEAFIAPAQIKETQLPHRTRSRWSNSKRFFESDLQAARKGYFSRCP